MDLNACAGAAYERADAAMNGAYAKLMKQIGPKTRDGLRAAQKAWLPFRNASCALEAMGVEGGSMQPQGHLQTVTRLIDHRMNAQAVLDAPRWRFNGGLAIDVEATFDVAVRDGLAALGHRVSVGDALGFGCGQFIVRLDDCYMTGSDPRRDSYPAGF